MVNFNIEFYFNDTRRKPSLEIEEVRNFNGRIIDALSYAIKKNLDEQRRIPEGAKFYIGWLGEGWFADLDGLVREEHEGKHLIVMDGEMVKEKDIKSPSVEDCAFWAEAIAFGSIGEMMREILVARGILDAEGRMLDKER